MTLQQKEEITKQIFIVLTYSDIVWPGHGSESIEELTEKIARKIEIIINNENIG